MRTAPTCSKVSGSNWMVTCVSPSSSGVRQVRRIAWHRLPSSSGTGRRPRYSVRSAPRSWAASRRRRSARARDRCRTRWAGSERRPSRRSCRASGGRRTCRSGSCVFFRVGLAGTTRNMPGSRRPRRARLRGPRSSPSSASARRTGTRGTRTRRAPGRASLPSIRSCRRKTHVYRSTVGPVLSHRRGDRLQRVVPTQVGKRLRAAVRASPAGGSSEGRPTNSRSPVTRRAGANIRQMTRRARVANGSVEIGPHGEGRRKGRGTG